MKRLSFFLVCAVSLLPAFGCNDTTVQPGQPYAFVTIETRPKAAQGTFQILYGVDQRLPALPQTIKFAPGNYQFSFEAEGYQRAIIDATFQAGETVSLYVFLARAC